MIYLVDKFDIFNVEFDVFDVFWEDSLVILVDVIVRLNKYKDWYEKIVKILLGWLVKKGVL